MIWDNTFQNVGQNAPFEFINLHGLVNLSSIGDSAFENVGSGNAAANSFTKIDLGDCDLISGIGVSAFKNCA